MSRILLLPPNAAASTITAAISLHQKTVSSSDETWVVWTENPNHTFLPSADDLPVDHPLYLVTLPLDGGMAGFRLIGADDFLASKLDQLFAN